MNFLLELFSVLELDKSQMLQSVWHKKNVVMCIAVPKDTVHVQTLLLKNPLRYFFLSSC